MSVLVVEDSHTMQLVMAGAVSSQREADVAICSTLAEAEHQVDSGGITLLLLDLTLEDAGPEQTIPAITRFTERGVCVIVMTGSFSPEIVMRCHAAGAVSIGDKARLSYEAIAMMMKAADEDPDVQLINELAGPAARILSRGRHAA